METLVVGAGAMGRWLGTVLQADYPEAVTLSFLDQAAKRADEATEAVGGRAVPTDTTESFDLVCISVPIPAATDAIQSYSEHATGAIIDVTGTMAAPVEAMAEHAPGRERMSLHPLFAPANEPGNIPAVVDESGPLTDALIEALRARDNEVFETTAPRHDEAMETVQARTHAAILAFGLSATEAPARFQTPISDALSELTEQVTDGDSRVYADIQEAFEGAEDVAEAARELADADREAFERFYADARLERGVADDDTADTLTADRDNPDHN